MKNKVWLSRPAGRADKLAAEFAQCGLQAVLVPAMEIGDLTDSADRAALGAYAADLQNFAASVFTTAEAARRVGAFFAAAPLPPAARNPPALAIGRATAEAVPVIYRLLETPKAVWDSGALLRLPHLQADKIRDAAVAILGGKDSKPPSPRLIDGLRERGGKAQFIPCYERRAANAAAAGEINALRQSGELVAAVAYSADSLRYMAQMLAPEKWLENFPVFVIHPNIARVAKEAGFTKIFTAKPKDLPQKIANLTGKV